MTQELRRAASVIAVREDRDGPQVLVVERSERSRFLPGYVVFPGGAVDGEDAARAAAWFGSPDEDARAAAVRELAEEAGLVLTSRGLESAARDDPVAPVTAAPPGTEQLPEVAHWIAPEEVPVRFDARYYAVAAPTALEPVADGTEAARAWWVAPGQLIADWEAGERKLYWPTLVTMRALALCRSPEELFGLTIQTREPDDAEVDRLPRTVFWQD